MIDWNRLNPGEYESFDKRFYITKSWNRLYGNHWKLYDRIDKNRLYIERTLLSCKLQAERIILYYSDKPQ
jgi:hypothetical protein